MKIFVSDIQENGLCRQVGLGTNAEFYKSIGMVERDVEQSEIDGQWYLSEKCPHLTPEERDAKAKESERVARIAELKALLASTDYIVLKIAEGSATKKEYAEKIAQRQAWRTEINDLEAEDSENA